MGQPRTSTCAGWRFRFSSHGPAATDFREAPRDRLPAPNSDFEVAIVTDVLERVTHKPPTEGIEGYTTSEREVVCREVV